MLYCVTAAIRTNSNFINIQGKAFQAERAGGEKALRWNVPGVLLEASATGLGQSESRGLEITGIRGRLPL